MDKVRRKLSPAAVATAAAAVLVIYDIVFRLLVVTISKSKLDPFLTSILTVIGVLMLLLLLFYWQQADRGIHGIGTVALTLGTYYAILYIAVNMM